MTTGMKFDDVTHAHITDSSVALTEHIDNDHELVRDLSIAASVPVELGDRLYGRIVPDGFGFATIDVANYQGRPRYKSGHSEFYDAESLIDYANNQAEIPRLYAEVAGVPTITAVFDDHDNDLPGRKEFRATYRLRYTAEWEMLAGCDGQFASARAFAEFIEDLQHVIAAPFTADLLDLVRKFKASKIAQLTEHHDDKSGDRVFRYETETQVSDELIAPDEFAFAIPIYRGQEPSDVRARFRYRATSGGVEFGLRIIQREKLLEDAFEEQVAVVEAGLPDAGRAYRGTC